MRVRVGWDRDVVVWSFAWSANTTVTWLLGENRSERRLFDARVTRSF